MAAAQTAFDPFAPWVLVALVLLAGGLTRRIQRSTPQPVRQEASSRALWGLAAALAALAAFWTVGVVTQRPLVTAWDQSAAAWGEAMRAAGWRPAAAALGDATAVLPMTVFTLLVGAVLWARRGGALAFGWWLVVSINSLWGRVLKDVIARPRPASAADTLVSGLSFPSGHTTGAVMVFGLLGWWLCRRLPPAGRWLGALCVAVLVAAVGTSRVVLGVHYFSDVLGGLLWASALLACAVAALRRWPDQRAR